MSSMIFPREKKSKIGNICKIPKSPKNIPISKLMGIFEALN